MLSRIALCECVVAAVLLCSSTGWSQPPPLHFEGDVPDSPDTHFFVAFEVPAGTAEIEIRHSDLSSENILDWGLNDPNGFRGWGGGNSEPAIVNELAASRSYVPGPIAAGTWEVVVGKALVTELPGRYSIDVFLRDTTTLAPQTERAAYADPGPLKDEARWYAGDFHVHSTESGDASATLDENLAFAATQGLDFIVLTEHNTNSQLSFYDDAQPRHPDVLIVPGVEFTTYAGHANAIGATEWVDHKIGVRGATIDDAIDDYHQQGALFSVNHPELNVGTLCIGCGWNHAQDPTTIDAVEVISGVFPGFRFWEDLLDQGSHAAALGGSDDHNAGMNLGGTNSPLGVPTTMVFAEELSVAAILQGVREGRTVVRRAGVAGPMIEFDIEGSRTGDTVAADESMLRASVTGAEAAWTARVVRNGEVFREVDLDNDPLEINIALEAPESGSDRYRVEVDDGRNIQAVTSHLWLVAPEPSPPVDPGDDQDDSGCAVGHGRRASPPLLLCLGACLALCVRRARS